MSQLLDVKPPNADDADATTSRLAERLGDRYLTSLDAANRFSSASKNDPDRVSSLLQRILPSRLLDERGRAERKDDQGARVSRGKNSPRLPNIETKVGVTKYQAIYLVSDIRTP